MNNKEEKPLKSKISEQSKVASDNIKDPDVLTIRQLERIRFNQDTNWRRYLATWVMIVDSAWLLFTATLLVLDGAKCLDISDFVMSVFLGTTTVNIIGLGYIVLKGLFPLSQKNTKK